MQRLIAAYRARTGLDKGGRVPPLDGLRFAFVFSVVAYHLWQQSWLTPGFVLFSNFISLDPWLRTGYLWVDGMLLLSGFLLFLPRARAMEAGRSLPGFTGFYKRRFLRIVPTYVFHLLLIFLIVALPERRYATWWAAARDWLAHLSFTHPFFYFSSVATPLNGALWTLGVEVQFYLIFPLLARVFTRMPLATYLGAAVIAFAFRALAMGQAQSPMLINQLPAFLDVYLNGFLAARVYARLEKGRDDGLSRAFMTAVLIAALVGLAALVRHQAAWRAVADLRVGQLKIRYTQSALTALLLLGSGLGLGGIRLLLGNRLSFFLSSISYQLYIWHQMVALQLKKWKIPQSVSENPHMSGEKSWQIGYVLLTLGISLLISALVTYLIEQPLSRLGQKKKST